MQRLLGDMRRADEQFSMIEKDSIIAVGLSGGKDSLALLSVLAAYRRIKPFTLTALTLVPKGLMDTAPLAALTAHLGVPYYIRESDLFDTLFGGQIKNPCALCARVRRGALVNMARERGASALALGHHLDDALATLLMALLKEGRFHTLAPKAPMERGGVSVIRPFILTRESAISAFCLSEGLTPVKNPCPVDRQTTRQEMNELIKKARRHYPDFDQKMTAALLKASFFTGPSI